MTPSKKQVSEILIGFSDHVGKGPQIYLKGLKTAQSQISELIEQAKLDEVGRFPNSVYCRKCDCLSCLRVIKRSQQLRKAHK